MSRGSDIACLHGHVFTDMSLLPGNRLSIATRLDPGPIGTERPEDPP